MEVECPFCGFQAVGGEQMAQLHIEQYHTEDSPFVAREEPTRPHSQSQGFPSPGEGSMPADTWTKCTRPHCGQYVLLTDIDEHLNLHEIEATNGDEESSAGTSNSGRGSGKRPRSKSPGTRPTRASPHTSPRKERSGRPTRADHADNHTLLKYFSGTSHKGRPPRISPSQSTLREPQEPGRLGKRELGPQAFERAMPARVRQCLEDGARPQQVNRIGRDGRLCRETFVQNETNELVYSISDLCALDPGTEVSYFCDPNTKHIVRINCEGNFCGYWNIQMLLSHIRGRDFKDRDDLQRLPTVLQIQETIEQAWDNGICPYGRIETGGVRGTRKWIGTHETVAYFTQIGVRVEALSFADEGSGSGKKSAMRSLLDHVEAYFMSGLEGCRVHRTSHVTQLAPIYLQRLGHSMAIVGLERKSDGSRNLLIFDPSFATSNAMKRFLTGANSYAPPERLLRAYRRSEVSLSAWKEFEIVVPQPYSEKRAP